MTYDSSAGNADHTWVSSFSETSTGSSLDAGSLQIYLVGAQAFKPQTTFNLAIEISNPAETVPSPITFQFDVTVVDFCKDSSLSFDTSFADVNYSIEVSPSPTQSETFPSVTTSTDATRCPFTVNL